MTTVTENITTIPVNDFQTLQLRENLIQSAIEFLQEPRVVSSPDERKRKFLKTKGLTDEEIDEAYRRAGKISSAVGPTVTVGPLVSSAVGPTVVQVPWKSMVLVLLTFSEVGRFLFYIIKKCLFPFIVKSQKSKHEKKYQAIQEDIKSQIKSISTRFSEQSTDLLTTLKVLKNSLGESKKSPRIKDEEPSTISPLRQEMNEIETTLPKILTPSTTSDSILSQHYHQLQDVVSSVRGAILEANGGIKSVGKLPTLPWKINAQSKPDWLAQKPTLPWISKEPTQTQQLSQSTPPSQSLSTNGTSSIGGNLNDTVNSEGVRPQLPKSLPIDITKSEGVQTDKSIDESGEKGDTSFAKGGNVYTGNLQKVIEMSQKRKKKNPRYSLIRVQITTAILMLS